MMVTVHPHPQGPAPGLVEAPPSRAAPWGRNASTSPVAASTHPPRMSAHHGKPHPHEAGVAGSATGGDRVTVVVVALVAVAPDVVAAAVVVGAPVVVGAAVVVVAAGGTDP